jgi:hypothetical protein
MIRQCAACGTTKNLGPSLGGVLLCRAHYEDISAQVEQLRAEGKQVNVSGIARQMFREQYSTGNYILRDIPKGLWDAAKHKAVDEDVSLRELVLNAVQAYLDK